MTIKPISQRDPKWKAEKLGFSNLTIGGYGCTLTSLTCLLNYVYGASYTPNQVNNKLKELGQYNPRTNPKGAFLGALLVWANVPLAYPKLKFIKRGYNYSNVEVAWNIYVKGMPVMVEVNAASIGAVKHWVLFVGGQKMIDPWTGTTESTSKYPLTGYSIYHRK